MEEWCRDGEIHRDDGAAYTLFVDGLVKWRRWYRRRG